MRSGVGLAHLALLHRLLAQLLHARLYPRHARVQEAGLRLDGDHLKPFLRRGLSNSCNGWRLVALGGPLEGWLVASKRVGALPRIHRVALGRGWGREGGGALPLPRAAIISTRLRVPWPIRPNPTTPTRLISGAVENSRCDRAIAFIVRIISSSCGGAAVRAPCWRSKRDN